MAKKKRKKKKVLKRLAQRRGERGRRKRVKVPKTAKAASQESEEAISEALRGSTDLIHTDELSDIHFPPDALTSYLEEVREGELADPTQFLREGVSRLSTPALLGQVRARLEHFERSVSESDPKRVSSSVVRRALEGGISPASIPLFAALLIRDVKDHPLADDTKIWKLVYPFLPSRIVTPGKREEEKTEYPHLILPGASEEK